MVVAVILLPERDCTTCKPANKKKWGCEKDLQIPMMFDGQPLPRCPRRPVLDYPDFFEGVWASYKWYSKGYLPDDGGIWDQPNAFMQMIDVMDSAKTDAENAKRDKDAREVNNPQVRTTTLKPQRATAPR